MECELVVWFGDTNVGDYSKLDDQTSDGELTDLAALALGYLLIGNGEYQHKSVGNFYWNPLENDLCANHLAKELNIYTMEVPEKGYVSARIRNGIRTMWHEPIGSDIAAAKRRAIVRAAAEIGRGKSDV